ncbi:uroporphyrinogen-III C-methyltransferase, partial [Klebsiella pneumoniae]|uniref:uroporphyrinogen-III C-methyltransferase n=1 Tax=Klebsiella pneumoniae TaxID=573 RepID=UPI0021B111BB
AQSAVFVTGHYKPDSAPFDWSLLAKSQQTLAIYMAYYDTDDATTKAFLDEVDKLSQQSITMTVPETLQSQALLEKLMQTRVRNLMAQPDVTAGGAPS